MRWLGYFYDSTRYLFSLCVYYFFIMHFFIHIFNRNRFFFKALQALRSHIKCLGFVLQRMHKNSSIQHKKHPEMKTKIKVTQKLRLHWMNESRKLRAVCVPCESEFAANDANFSHLSATCFCPSVNLGDSFYDESMISK